MEEYRHSKEYEDELKYLYWLFSLAWKVEEVFKEIPLISKETFLTNSTKYLGGTDNE